MNVNITFFPSGIAKRFLKLPAAFLLVTVVSAMGHFLLCAQFSITIQSALARLYPVIPPLPAPMKSLGNWRGFGDWREPFADDLPAEVSGAGGEPRFERGIIG
jgi:hypothetical protein